jgi:hypothetical protein
MEETKEVRKRKKVKVLYIHSMDGKVLREDYTYFEPDDDLYEDDEIIFYCPTLEHFFNLMRLEELENKRVD